jgi:hypothetical protein
VRLARGQARSTRECILNLHGSFAKRLARLACDTQLFDGRGSEALGQSVWTCHAASAAVTNSN